MRKQSLILGMIVLIVMLFTACGSLPNSDADVINEISRPTDTVETPQELPDQQVNEPASTYNSASVNDDIDCGQFADEPESKAVCESQNLSSDQLVADESTLLDALGSGDVAKCAEIMNVHDRDDCYFNLAYKLVDVKVCDPITGFSTKIVCQRELGS